MFGAFSGSMRVRCHSICPYSKKESHTTGWIFSTCHWRALKTKLFFWRQIIQGKLLLKKNQIWLNGKYVLHSGCALAISSVMTRTHSPYVWLGINARWTHVLFGSFSVNGYVMFEFVFRSSRIEEQSPWRHMFWRGWTLSPYFYQLLHTQYSIGEHNWEDLGI